MKKRAGSFLITLSIIASLLMLSDIFYKTSHTFSEPNVQVWFVGCFVCFTLGLWLEYFSDHHNANP